MLPGSLAYVLKEMYLSKIDPFCRLQIKGDLLRDRLLNLMGTLSGQFPVS
jgi:hypothetical protein